ncbi:hypothetical protein FQA39_LY18416 [Lamprigera yunnana]|nr:hypothetical protein FQA39_LY18416 [Lamprigera yunnana]
MKLKIINKKLAEARRFNVDVKLGSSFTYIRDKILEFYPNLIRSSLKITWKDNDGDFITITGDDDLFIALYEMDKRTKVFYVETTQNNIWSGPFGVGLDVAQLQALTRMVETFLQAFTVPRNVPQSGSRNGSRNL